MRAVREAAALSAACAALVAGGCGGDGEGAPPAGVQRFDDPTRLMQYTCEDWKRAAPAQRVAVLGALREVTGGPVTGGGVAGRGTVLEDDAAQRLFDGHCRNRYARSFVLYKLYGQAAGFIGVAP